MSYEECLSYVRDTIEKHPSYPHMESYWMVFDLDDTLITDIRYRNTFNTAADTFRFQYRGIHDPITPIVTLYNWCISIGMKVCIITARSRSLMSASERNLLHIGIRKCNRLYMKNNRMDVVRYKTICREQLDGHILFNIGDKDTDLINSTATYNIKLPSTYQ